MLFGLRFLPSLMGLLFVSSRVHCFVVQNSHTAVQLLVSSACLITLIQNYHHNCSILILLFLDAPLLSVQLPRFVQNILTSVTSHFSNLS